MRYRNLWAIWLCAWSIFLLPQASLAVPVDGLYDGSVTGNSTEAGRSAAAAEALRQVVVRVTGRSAAASEPALQGLYSDAAKYVQTFRSVASGQVTVTFDAGLVDAALAKAGQHVWGRDRPRVYAILVGSPASQLAARRDLDAVAVLRGLPVSYPETAAEPPADLRDGRPEALLAWGRSAGAEVVLVLRLGPNASTGTWVGPGGAGSTNGSVEDVFQALADRVGGALATPVTEPGRVRVVVHGVDTLRAYVSVTTAIAGFPSVRSVVVDAVVASTLKLHLVGSADAAVVRKAARDAGHFEVGEAGGAREVDLEYHP
jgi:Uncharacterized protein conserved in bacteria (DUF2066)